MSHFLMAELFSVDLKGKIHEPAFLSLTLHRITKALRHSAKLFLLMTFGVLLRGPTQIREGNSLPKNN